MNKRLLFILAAGFLVSLPRFVLAFDLAAQVQDYDRRYQLEDPLTKKVDNYGNGDDSLYGVRNFRVVLKGVYYRGGANNFYNKYGKRGNQNPLPDLGLKDLCQEGFSDAIYLYPDHFSTAPRTTNCQISASPEASSLNYNQVTVLNGKERPLLQMIFEHITGQRPGPVYAHCWNGWHASGYLAAISLRQFCGWTAAQAVDYWIKGTDGNSSGHQSLLNKISEFTPYPEFAIDPESARLICPSPVE